MDRTTLLPQQTDPAARRKPTKRTQSVPPQQQVKEVNPKLKRAALPLPLKSVPRVLPAEKLRREATTMETMMRPLVRNL